MNRTVIVCLAGFWAGMCSPGIAVADDVVPVHQNGWQNPGILSQEGRRLLEAVPAENGVLWVSGGISTAPCVPGVAERRADGIYIPLNDCGVGAVFTEPVRLPVRIAWRTGGMPALVRYLSGADRYLTLPVDRGTMVSLLHLVVSYE